MSGTNQILPFATDSGANVLSQSAYLADSQRPVGNQPGIARAPLVNKALRQLSALAAGFGQFLANRQSADVTDSLTPTAMEALIQEAFAQTSTLPPTISTSAHSWWRRSSDGYIEQGVSGIAVPASGSNVVVTFPIPFLTTVLDIQVSVNPAAAGQVGWSTVTLTQVSLETSIADSLGRTANIVVRGY